MVVLVWNCYFRCVTILHPGPVRRINFCSIFSQNIKCSKFCPTEVIQMIIMMIVVMAISTLNVILSSETPFHNATM